MYNIRISKTRNRNSNVERTTLGEMIDDIQSNRSELFEKIRSGDKEAKAGLPAYCMGVFNPERSSEDHKINRNLVDFHSAQVVVLDIDNLAAKVDSPTPIPDIKADLHENDEFATQHAAFAFRSPSGDGLKVGYILSKPLQDPFDYSRVYEYLALQFEEAFQVYVSQGETDNPEKLVDVVAKDAARLCYLSYDPNIYIDDDPTEIIFEEIQHLLPAPEDYGRRATIELKGNEQSEIFLDISKRIEVKHYKEIRDLCSAASRIAEKYSNPEFLRQFLTNIVENNKEKLSPGTRNAMRNIDTYVRSFMRPHQRVPLQYIINTAQAQGYRLPRMKHAKKGTPMFNISKQKAAIVKLMNERYASYDYGQHVIIRPPKRKYYVDLSADESIMYANRNTLQIKKRTDFKEFMRNKQLTFINEQGEFSSIPYFDIWWESPARRDIFELITSPDTRQIKGFESLWTGYNVSPARIAHVRKIEEETGELVCQPILDFFKKIVCDNYKERYDFLLKWVADLLQNPTTKKPGVTLVLHGKKGTGKGTFDLVLRDMIGPAHSKHMNDIDNILSNFNAITMGALLVTLDEALYKNDKRKQNKLKSMITENVGTLEKKFVDAKQTDDVARYLMLSNYDHVVQFSHDNRRFVVFRISDAVARNYDYFASIRECMSNYGKESLFSYLSSYEYSVKDIMTHKLTTESMELQKQSSLDSLDVFLQQMLLHEEINVQMFEGVEKISVVSSAFYSEAIEVHLNVLYRAYLQFTKDQNERYPLKFNQFYHRLTKEMPLQYRSRQYNKWNESDFLLQFESPSDIFYHNFKLCHPLHPDYEEIRQDIAEQEEAAEEDEDDFEFIT